MPSGSDFDTASQLPVEVKIPGYRLRRQVGADAIGLWFDAEQESLGRKVTVKVLKPKFQDHPGAHREFLAEMDRLARIDHPNLIRVIDTVTDETPVLITERIGLKSLATLLASEKPLGEKTSLHYARCVARALHHLQTKGLAHKNVNPFVVMLHEDGGCRLVTFRNIIPFEEQAKLKGRLVQDPKYAAPEQVGGEKPIGPTAACYQVACLLFHMLAARPPHAKDDPKEVAKAHLLEDFPRLKRLQPFLKPRGIYDLIAVCTERDPEDRPDLETVVRALDDLIAGRDPGLEAKRTGGVVAPRPRRRRRRR